MSNPLEIRVNTRVRCHADCLVSPVEHRCTDGVLLRHEDRYDDGRWWRMSGNEQFPSILVHESELEVLPLDTEGN